MTRILLLNGPNLASLGEREPEVYGSVTLAEIDAAVRDRAASLGLEVRCEQTNHEGAMVDLLEAERGQSAGCIVNPGGLTHTSVVLADALRGFGGPVVEVHLSNILAREPFRRVSLSAEAAVAVISGLGLYGYVLAVEGLAKLIEDQPDIGSTA
ncbi:MAG TPA: type II 3-dehydroquinate dehydratase [Candidatus Dormibacteraeota bacterium]|jgi:3-dehydroquinate dehydratase II